VADKIPPEWFQRCQKRHLVLPSTKQKPLETYGCIKPGPVLFSVSFCYYQLIASEEDQSPEPGLQGFDKQGGARPNRDGQFDDRNRDWWLQRAALTYILQCTVQDPFFPPARINLGDPGPVLPPSLMISPRPRPAKTPLSRYGVLYRPQSTVRRRLLAQLGKASCESPIRRALNE
jgi:hypothetical protein